MQKVHLQEEYCQLLDEEYPTYDQILNLLDELESGELKEKCTEEQLDKINHFLAMLAKEGVLPGEDTSTLDNDIAVLFKNDASPFQFAYAFDDDYYVPSYNYQEILLCKSWIKKNWGKTKKFVKDHKKEIIIGAVVIVAVVAVVVAVAVASTVGATAAAGAAGAAASSAGSDKEEKEKFKDTTDTPALAVIEEAPTLKAAIDEHVSSFKEFASEDIVLQTIDYQKDPSLGEKARNIGAILAHETLEGIPEIASVVPQLLEEIREISSYILPENSYSNNTSSRSLSEDYRNLVNSGHQAIDRAFATNQAGYYEGKRNDLVIGILPPPGNFSKGLNISKFKDVLKTGKETVLIAEDLGFSSREIVELDNAGILDKTVADTVNKIYKDNALATSLRRFEYAEKYLEPFLGKYMPEIEAKSYINQAGIRTFPKPEGIPENYRVKLSNTGAGIKYVHPKDTGTYVRVMPGKPHSMNPSQQKPYINHRINGRSLDKNGNFVPNKSPEAHIPIDEFVYRNIKLYE